MKQWKKPEVDELNISCTEQGRYISNSFDEVRVDQNNNYWVSFASGVDTKPNINGEVVVKP